MFESLPSYSRVSALPEHYFISNNRVLFNTPLTMQSTIVKEFLIP